MSISKFRVCMFCKFRGFVLYVLSISRIRVGMFLEVWKGAGPEGFGGPFSKLAFSHCSSSSSSSSCCSSNSSSKSNVIDYSQQQMLLIIKASSLLMLRIYASVGVLLCFGKKQTAEICSSIAGEQNLVAFCACEELQLSAIHFDFFCELPQDLFWRLPIHIYC